MRGKGIMRERRRGRGGRERKRERIPVANASLLQTKPRGRKPISGR